jgi:acyl-CoA synthetase (NDP forming)
MRAFFMSKFFYSVPFWVESISGHFFLTPAWDFHKVPNQKKGFTGLNGVIMEINLSALFHPATIAVIGASSDKSKFSNRVVEALRTLKYRGVIYLVNTNPQAVPGEQVFCQVSEVPGDIDLAIIFVPARAVPSALEDCARKGVKMAIVHGAGFAELGEEGRFLQEGMAETARTSGMRIVGPNCMGIACPSSGINMVTTRHPFLEHGGVSFSGQSGWATEYTLLVGQDRGLGFSTVVSCGNQADLSIADYLNYFGADPDTKVIGAYVEGFKDGPRFFKAAGQAAKQKPVVIWKSGRTPDGARFTQSHTGSIAGAGEVAKAVFDQTGVEEAVGIEELMDTLVAFHSPLLPRGRRVGLVVDTGGIGVAACDACWAMGLEIPQLPLKVQQDLEDYFKKILPPFAGIANPVDLVWAPVGMEEEIYGRSMEMMAPWVDAFIVGYYPSENHEGLARFLAQIRDRFQKPVLSVPPYGHIMQPFMRFSTQMGVPSFDSMERAVRALRRLVRRAEWLRRESGIG